MATQKENGRVSRAVREALSTLVSPQLCEQLINRSLLSQGLDAVPESGTVIGEWLEGALRGEVETAVGPDAADLMMMELGPIAAYAAIAGSTPKLHPVSGPPENGNAIEPLRLTDPEVSDRPTRQHGNADGGDPAWTMPSAPPTEEGRQPSKFGSDPPTGVFQAPPEDDRSLADFSAGRHSSKPPLRSLSGATPLGGATPPSKDRTGRISTRGRPAQPSPRAPVSSDPYKPLPLVLTATGDRDAFDSLCRYLSQAAKVVHVPDLVGLLDTLEEPDAIEPVVLIDCHSPTLHVSSVSAIGEDFPRGTTVVLWGVDDVTWHQIDRERSPACRWVRCSSEATTDDVGSLCSMLLG